jgi:hypothetical protein
MGGGVDHPFCLKGSLVTLRFTQLGGGRTTPMALGWIGFPFWQAWGFNTPSWGGRPPNFTRLWWWFNYHHICQWVWSNRPHGLRGCLATPSADLGMAELPQCQMGVVSPLSLQVVNPPYFILSFFSFVFFFSFLFLLLIFICTYFSPFIYVCVWNYDWGWRDILTVSIKILNSKSS